MRKNMLTVILGICAITIMAACGKNTANNTVSSGGTIHDTSVSGSVVSASAVGDLSVQGKKEKQQGDRKFGETDITKLRYANDWSIFEGDQDKGIYQYDLTGKEEQYYDLDLEIGGEELSFTVPEVLWVDNDWVFISCHRNQEYYEIWRVPVNQKDAQKRLRMEKKEKLVKVKRLYALITKTDQEIIYCADEKIYRMDLQNQNIQELKTNTQEWEFEIIQDADGIPFVQDGKAYYNDTIETKMYQIDLEEWTIIPMGPSCDGAIASDGTSLYFVAEGLIKYDTGTGKKETLISEAELTKKILDTDVPTKEIQDKRKTKWSMINDVFVKTIYHQKDRLYLAVEMNYKADVKDEDDMGNYAEIMLSCLASDGSDLQYEKTLTEYLWGHSVSYLDSSGEFLWEELTGDFSQQLDGCIMMHFYDEEIPDEDAYELEEHYRFVMYDLCDGTFWNVNKPSDAYGYMKALGYSFYEEAHC